MTMTHDHLHTHGPDELAMLRAECDKWHNAYDRVWEERMRFADRAIELEKENKELKAKLEDVQASAYAESVDAGMENRKLKHALWLARAERANEIHFMWCQLIYDKKYGIVKFNVRKEWYKNVKQGQTLHTPQGWADVWDEVEYRCRAKAEEYK